MRELKKPLAPLRLQFHAKEKRKSKSKFLILVGLLVIAILAVGFYLVMTYENGQVKTLVGYFNEVDEIFDKALEYDKAGAGKSTPEQWSELNTKAEDIKKKLDEVETDDTSKNIKEAIYYYDDALITALTYGQDYARTNNPVTQNKVTRNIQEANLNRKTALDFINDDFPREAKKINKNEDIPEVTQQSIRQ